MKRTMILTIAVLLGASAAFAQSVRAILPVAGSAEGAFGSQFKTELQLNNRSTVEVRGTMVFHPIGQSASAGDPRLAYTLAPHQTLEYEDVVAALGTSGLGSIDFEVIEGGVPAVVARAFDDKGENGTTGTNIDLVDPREAFTVGQSTALVLPADRERFRFNIGVRTLEGGARLGVRIFGPDGVQRGTATELNFAPNFFTQQPAETLIGTTLLANESVAFEILAGSVVLYGTTTDNATNDPNVQLAQ